MENQHGFHCPQCKNGSHLRISAHVWADLLPDGCDTSDSDTEWDDTSAALCTACNWSGTVSQLLVVEDEDDEEDEKFITICQLANYRLGREATTGQDFLDARLPMMGGCEGCGASIACYNSYPSKSGNLRCEDCIGNFGYKTVDEADEAIFPPEERKKATV
jgi:hypothetical protein